MQSFLIADQQLFELVHEFEDKVGTRADLRGRVLAFVEDEVFARVNLHLNLQADAKDFRALSPNEDEFYRHLVAPKTTHMVPEMASALRFGFDLAKKAGCFEGQSGPAHKAWVTMREWDYLAKEGRFTHRVEVRFENEDHFSGKAVNLEHARALARRAKMTHRRRFDIPAGHRLNAKVLVTAIDGATDHLQLRDTYTADEAHAEHRRIDATGRYTKRTKAAFKAHVTRRIVREVAA